VFCFPSTTLANQIFKIPFARSGSLCGSFSYEGLFRQAIVYKNRNRDTTWYGMINAEWPEIRAAFDTWLDPANFDADGNQKAPLAARRDFGTD